MSSYVGRRAFLGGLGGLGLNLSCGTGETLAPGPAETLSPGPAPEAEGDDPTPASYRDVMLHAIPHVRQRPDFCGEACVEMILKQLRVHGDQDDVFDASEVDPAEGRGCYTADLKRAMERLGLDPGPVWYELDADRERALETCWARVHADLLTGVPAIVCMRYDEAPDTSEHMRLIVGYDPARDEVIYHEPAEDDGAARRMPRVRLFGLWPLHKADGDAFCVHLAGRPGARGVTIPRPGPGHRPADYCQRVRALRSQLAGRHFTVVLEEPFVVAGDDPPERVRQRSQATIRWAVDRLRAAYFDEDPQQLNTVWLFKDKRSYERHTLEFFGERPDTPYGYYSRAKQALIMNIKTGGGTLVHELVHPFIESNFPACPSWFDEGLASLYEQCTEQDGQIWGLTNWRLDGLQQAIRAGTLPSFQTLCETTSDEFYNHDPGTNYAQARYLCHWLQEAGLLRRFYRAFQREHGRDPSGYVILQEVLGRDATEMTAFQREWERSVLALRFG